MLGGFIAGNVVLLSFYYLIFFFVVVVYCFFFPSVCRVLCCAIEDFVDVSGVEATQLSDSHDQLPISGPVLELE